MRTICLVGPYSSHLSAIGKHLRRLEDVLKRAKLDPTIVDTDGSSEVADDVIVAPGVIDRFKKLWAMAPSIVDIHTEKMDPVIGLMAILLAAKHQILISLHSGSPASVSFMTGLVERVVLGRARLVIVHDASTRDRIAKHTWKGKVMALPEYLPPTEAPANDRSEVTALRNDHPYVILAAAPEIGVRHGGDVHGVPFMIETAHRLQEEKGLDVAVIFHVERTPEPSVLNDMRKRVSEAGLGERWLFLDGPPKTLQSLWTVADVLVRPGVAPLERILQRDAMSLGLPVLTNDASDIESGAWSYAQGDGSDFAKTLHEVLSDLKKAKERLESLPFRATPDRYAQMYRTLVRERVA